MVMIAGIALLVLAALFFYRKGTAPDDIFGKFGLSPGAFTLVSSDLGDSAPRQMLRGNGVNGEPDALFAAKSGRKVVVGEYKSRKFRGFVRPYEFFQTILYMGMARQVHNTTEALGVIAYADGRVQIHFDQAVYDALVGLRIEMFVSFKERKPVNTKPLQKRMNVLGSNRHIKFG
jgi:hypothetical protein